MADLPAPRPFYRSRLFWLGMPGVLFLLWAWGRSNVVRHKANLGQSGWVWSSQGKLCWHDVNVAAGAWEVTVDYREGTLSVNPQEEFVTRCGFGLSPSLISRTTVMIADRRWFPPPRWEVRQLDASSSYRLISLPYWMMTGGYAVLWLGGLSAWQRRKSRVWKTSTTSPP
jgi:hypothetical protein